jgi:hypothetical protein
MKLTNERFQLQQPPRICQEPQPDSPPDPEPVDNLTELSRLFHAPEIPFLYHPIDI